MSNYEISGSQIVGILGVLAFFAGWLGAFLAISFGAIVENNATVAIISLEPKRQESLLAPYHGLVQWFLADAHAVIDDPYIDQCRRRYVMAGRLAFVSFGTIVLGLLLGYLALLAA